MFAMARAEPVIGLRLRRPRGGIASSRCALLATTADFAGVVIASEAKQSRQPWRSSASSMF